MVTHTRYLESPAAASLESLPIHEVEEECDGLFDAAAAAAVAAAAEETLGSGLSDFISSLAILTRDNISALLPVSLFQMMSI